MDPLGFETVKPTLGWRVIPAVPLTTHGTLHTVYRQLALDKVGYHIGCPDPS
jgi:hypothetical protein